MSAEPKPSDKTSPVPVGPAAREATPPEWEPEDPLWMTVMPEDVDSNDKLSALHSLIYADTTANERATNFKVPDSPSPSFAPSILWPTFHIQVQFVILFFI